MSRRLLVVTSLAALVVLLSWCGTPVTVCDGCLAGGQCVPLVVSASAATQCGSAGGQCVACAESETCHAGACVAQVASDGGEGDAGDGGSASDGGADGGDLDAGLFDAGAADAGGAGDAGAGDAGPVARVRLMAANLTAGTTQRYDTPPGDVAPGPGIRIMQGARPDIVMVQEFRIGADDAAALQAMGDLVLGTTSYVCREVIDGPGDLPNGIISRFPILACGEWQDSRVSNRDYAYARIDVPGPKDLWAISVHLHTQEPSRPIEGAEVVQHVMSDIPAGDWVVLGGDLNTDDVSESVFTTLSGTFAVMPMATDQFGNPGTNTNRLITLADGGLDPVRNQPYDWVMPTPALMARQVPIVLADGVTTYTLPHGLVIDTRVFDAGTIGLLAPAQLGDSAAQNMQHMGVIRDFELPLQ